MDKIIGNTYYMVFDCEADVDYWCNLFGLTWPNVEIACCGGYYNALVLDMA